MKSPLSSGLSRSRHAPIAVRLSGPRLATFAGALFESQFANRQAQTSFGGKRRREAVGPCGNTRRKLKWDAATSTPRILCKVGTSGVLPREEARSRRRDFGRENDNPATKSFGRARGRRLAAIRGTAMSVASAFDSVAHEEEDITYANAGTSATEIGIRRASASWPEHSGPAASASTNASRFELSQQNSRRSFHIEARAHDDGDP